MEVAARRLEVPQQVREVYQLLGDQASQRTAVLPRPVDTEQARLEHRLALLVPNALEADDLHRSGLVLQRHEDDAGGRVRLLPQLHDAGVPHMAPILDAMQLCGGS